MTIATTVDRPRVRVRAGETALSTAAFLALTQAQAQQGAGAPRLDAAALAQLAAAAPQGEAPQSPALEPGAQERHGNGKFKKGEDPKDEDEDEDKDGDEVSDEEETTGSKKKKASAARSRERARCAAILSSEAGMSRPKTAQLLAFGTTMTRSQALATLENMPEEGGNSLAAAMRGYANAPVGPGAAAEPPPAATIAKGWDNALAKHTPAAPRGRR